MNAGNAGGYSDNSTQSMEATGSKKHILNGFQTLLETANKRRQQRGEILLFASPRNVLARCLHVKRNLRGHQTTASNGEHKGLSCSSSSWSYYLQKECKFWFEVCSGPYQVKNLLHKGKGSCLLHSVQGFPIKAGKSLQLPRKSNK